MTNFLRHALLCVLYVVCAAMAGCATAPEAKIVTQTEYVVKIPPADLMTPPPQVPPIDVDTATQGDVAKWIAAQMDRANQLESKLEGVAKFLTEQQTDLNAPKHK